VFASQPPDTTAQLAFSMTTRSSSAAFPSALRADSALFVELTRSLLETGSQVRFCATGTSMHPAIQHADHITVAPLAGAIAKGDVILCRQGRGPTAHRVVGIRHDDSGRLVLRGDNTDTCDVPVRSTHVLGRVVMTRRGAAEHRIRRQVLAHHIRRPARLVRALVAWVAL
jgi:hypothetical protein